MDIWKSPPERDDENVDRPNTSEPTFLEKLTEYAKDEAMAAAVEHLSGGWITLENADEDEDRPRGKEESFEERLQRGLAKLMTQATDGQQEMPESSHPVDAELPSEQRPVLSKYASVPRTAYQAPNGFGRKGL